MQAGRVACILSSSASRLKCTTLLRVWLTITCSLVPACVIMLIFQLSVGILTRLPVCSFMWRQQHVVGHHSFTNVDNYDPDISNPHKLLTGWMKTLIFRLWIHSLQTELFDWAGVKDPDFRRVTCEQPRRWYHAYQVILPLIDIFTPVTSVASVYRMSMCRRPCKTSLPLWCLRSFGNNCVGTLL